MLGKNWHKLCILSEQVSFRDTVCQFLDIFTSGFHNTVYSFSLFCIGIFQRTHQIDLPILHWVTLLNLGQSQCLPQCQWNDHEGKAWNACKNSVNGSTKGYVKFLGDDHVQRYINRVWISYLTMLYFFSLIYKIVVHLGQNFDDTGNGHCRSLNMRILILTQLLIFAVWFLLRPFLEIKPKMLV